MGLRARFGAPFTSLNSRVVIIMLLTVPRRRPSVFLNCMSMLFHTVLVTLLFVSLVVFSSTVSIFPFAPSIVISLINLPLPQVSCPLPLCPLTLWAYCSIIYLFSLNSLSVTNYLSFSD
jgi:hypothetical protein